MEAGETPTMVATLNGLIKRGFTEDFVAEESCVKALNSKKEYKPEDLLIIEVHRFEGMTNPGDSSELLALEATDGTKGTLVTNYGANVSQNEEMIKRIRIKS